MVNYSRVNGELVHDHQAMGCQLIEYFVCHADYFPKRQLGECVVSSVLDVDLHNDFHTCISSV